MNPTLIPPRLRPLLVLVTGLATALRLTAADPAPAHSAVTPEPRTGGPQQRFEALNRRVQLNQGDLDAIFVGDSITQGWEGAGKDVWQMFYGKQRVLNLGIGGDRTQHVLWRLDHGNADGINPKVAVVMIGTNNSGDDRNSASEMVDGIRAVIDKLQERLPQTRILLLGIFPRGEKFNNQRGKINQVNQVLRKWHDGDLVTYLDIGHHFLEADGSISKEIMPDFLHLTPRGYQIWAQKLEPTLADLLSRPRLRRIDPSGDWVWSIRGPEDRMVEAGLTLKLDHGKVTGKFIMNPERQLDIEQGTFDGAKLHLTVRRNRPNGGVIVYQMEATVEGDKLSGTVQADLDGTPVTREWNARRKETSN